MALMKENESNKKESKGKMVLGFLLAFASITMLTVACGGTDSLQYFFSYFVDGLGLVVFVGLCLAGVLLSGKKTKDAKLSVLQKIAIPNGVLLTMMRLTFMWRRLDDWSALGPAVAMATLLIIYGVVTYVVATLLLEREKAE